MRPFPALVLFLALGPVIATPLAAPARAVSTVPRPVFGRTKALPPAPGLGLKHNSDAEPGIGASPDGQIWIASDVDPGTDDPRVAEAVSGTDIWTSTDNGVTFRYVADPFGSTSRTPGLGGEDTDIAVAPVRNSQDHYTVYAGSLYIGNTSVAYSTDGGGSWTLLPVDGTPAQDREWLAADGPCTVYVGYHQNPGTQIPFVSTLDVCNGTKVRESSALSPADTQRFLAGTVPFESNLIGKLVVDTHPRSPYAHRIYFPMEQCFYDDIVQAPVAYENSSSPSCTGKAELIVGISSDGGATFTDVHVATSPEKTLSIWPATMAVDDAGTAYFAWHDSKHSYLNVSKDGGQHWSPSIRLDGATTAAVYPTVAADRAGHVDVLYVGTDSAGDSNNAKVFGKPGKAESAAWRIVDARSDDSGRTFRTTAVSDVVHRGALCTYGGACAGDGSRDFLDDFGAVLSPTTHRLTTVFSSDQPTGKRVDNFTAFVTERPAGAVPPVRLPPVVRPTTPGHHGSGLAATGGSLTLATLALTVLGAAGLLRRRVRQRY